MAAAARARLRIYASAVFFVGYLLVQVGVPAYSRATTHLRGYAWNMYVGTLITPSFVVVYEDGTVRRLRNLGRRTSPVRVHSAAVDRVRFVPPHICADWPGVREVRVRRGPQGPEQVVPCQSTRR